MKSILRLLLLLLLLVGNSMMVSAQQSSASKKNQYSVRVTVLDSLTNEPIVGAPCQIKSIGVFAVTDIKGVASFRNIPSGDVLIDVAYLGYQALIKSVRLTKDMVLTLKIVETSLQLKEVSVVAKNNAAGASTSSTIGRQAIEHLQATNLGDLMQLLPGGQMQTTDLTKATTMQIRNAGTGVDKNNSFGTSIIVDGVPVSNNANIESALSGNNNTAGQGADLRQISADNIESVEVIRGIPSAEYGDLTSGAVIVKSKSGRTPFEIRTKVNPTLLNTSVGKGFELGKKAGFLNTNFDYAQAWGDPRKKDESFDRYSMTINYGNTFFKKWKTNTKFSFSGLIDWTGKDPDAVADGTEENQTNNTFKISHEGKFALNLPFMRTLSYVFGFSTTVSESHKTDKIENLTGYKPIITALETGYYEVPYQLTSYYAGGGVKSNPQDFFAKVSNSCGFNVLKGWSHQIGMGIEYRYEQNKAAGYYNDDDLKPLRPNSDGRPRPYYDIPPLNQLSAYLEDKMSWKTFGRKTNLSAGVRFTMLQPGKVEQVSALSPRINASIELFDKLDLRLGFGQNVKTPGLTHLYPDNKYNDRVAVNTVAATNPAERMVMYHTMVYDVQRSVGLKNVVSTKYELGLDYELPNNKTISLVLYQDQTPNGFGFLAENVTYFAEYYELGKGLKYNPGAKPTLDKTTQPARTDTVFISTGRYGNTSWTRNRGLELDADLGRIEAIQTSFYVGGAYMETASKSAGIEYVSPKNYVGSVYVDESTPPFRYIYEYGNAMKVVRSINTTFRAVTHIPVLNMILSNSVYVTWYTYDHNLNEVRYPIGYIVANGKGGVDTYPITQAMLGDPNYLIKGKLLSDSKRDPEDKVPTVNRNPVWNLSTRLTKEISKQIGFSFYVNNTLYYEPWHTSSTSTTLTQKNKGTFSFGVELSLKL